MIVFNICKNIPTLDPQIEKKSSCFQWISFRDRLVSVDTETQGTSEVFVWSHARWCVHGSINGWYLVPLVPKCIPSEQRSHSFSVSFHVFNWVQSYRALSILWWKEMTHTYIHSSATGRQVRTGAQTHDSFCFSELYPLLWRHYSWWKVHSRHSNGDGTGQVADMAEMLHTPGSVGRQKLC